jgi:hypothetical protein
MCTRFEYDQMCDWRAAMRLNFSAREPATFSDLRRIYKRIAAGAQYGRSSGYQG